MSDNNDVAAMFELLRSELLKPGKNSLFFVANSDQELLLVKKKIGDELVWALPKDEDCEAFAKKLADHIKQEAGK